MEKGSTEKKKNLATKKQQPSTPKVFGAPSFVINEDDASRLVGGIVEKGFSEQPQNSKPPLGPSSAPRPTVLPFPVARHRSHGPHWSAMRSDISGYRDHDGGDFEKEEEDDDLFMDPVAAFANPVQRKEKKGLDFSRWQEIMKGDELSGPPTSLRKKRLLVSRDQKNLGEATGVAIELNKRLTAKDDSLACATNELKQQGWKMEEQSSPKSEVEKQEEDNSDMVIEESLQNGVAKYKKEVEQHIDPMDVYNKDMMLDMPMRTSDTASGFGSHKLVNERGAMSIQSQIDAENCARLKSMSAAEISEAQAEIMAKMSPALISALRKRGQEKLEKQKSHCPNMATAIEVGTLQNDQNLGNTSTCSLSTGSLEENKADPKDIQRDSNDSVNTKTNTKHSSLWDSWSKRVESVRDVRFSIDGQIIEISTSEGPNSGTVSTQSEYSVANVSERDFLRTEGNPGAAGYTIKEAVALTRSVVPGQRVLALHLIASVLDRAIHSIQQNPVCYTWKYSDNVASSDWEAIWAFALGPEPELALSLRMCLDDNHYSVVLACSKAIQSALSCDINESLFDILENVPTCQKSISTAPVFRSRPEIDDGFLHGGFWKYNTKPANVVPFNEDSGDDKPEDEHTIQDDVVVAGQDLAAGLVRMGILPRVQYLLETDPSAALEESLLSILIAIARHSPTSAAAIMKCEMLLQTITDRFAAKEQMEINSSRIKSVTLLRVLAQHQKENCIGFINSGIFQKLTWQLYRYAFSFDQWVKSGKDACKLSSALLVEQLRFLKVCVQFGHCVSYASDLFPALCTWLTVPTFEKLVEKNILSEFAVITKEAYLVLDALAMRLPNFYSHMCQTAERAVDDAETWCWSLVGPTIDLALEWTAVKRLPFISRLFDWQKTVNGHSFGQELALNSLLWVFSSVIHFLSDILAAVIPDSTISKSEKLPWLPQFVPKVGLQIIKNGLLKFPGLTDRDSDNLDEGGSFLTCLSCLRDKGNQGTAVASVSCLEGLVKVVVSVDKLIRLANPEISNASSNHGTFSREDEILANGMVHSSQDELEHLFTTYMHRASSQWQHIQSVEMFGRGGPAPGVGVGWGASGGGFWSMTVLSAQIDSRLLVCLLESFKIFSANDKSSIEDMSSMMQMVDSGLGACLVAGPRDISVLEGLFCILFQVPALKLLDSSICKFLHLNMELKPFRWRYEEEEYLLFSNILASHFQNRWLSPKMKSKLASYNKHGSKKVSQKGTISLDTIHEEVDMSNNAGQKPSSLVMEWAHQRLPLPMHWFLSPISTTRYGTSGDSRPADMQDPADFLEVAKAGLFFLLGTEAVSSFLGAGSDSSVHNVPLVWKLHALSVVLLVGMGVLEEEKSRDTYETLQAVYGQILDKLKAADTPGKVSTERLKFQTEIHESYSTFIENLVEQFAAVSYGNPVFGRQVALYLHRCVEVPVRLAAWNALSNSHALELLPPLEKCFSKPDGFLEPVEDDASILEAYVKSWVSGALDRAVTRGSAAYTLVLHHLACFIFEKCSHDMNSLRNKLVKTLLRDYCRKQQRKAMVMNLIEYNRPATCSNGRVEEAVFMKTPDITKRFEILRDACEGNSSLVREVEKLETSVRH